MISIEAIRRRAALGTTLLLWLNFGLLALSAATFSQAPVVPLLVGGLGICLVWTIAWRIDPVGPATRFLSGIVHAAMVALLVFAFIGSPLQVDMHMYFFAVLAICAVWIDWRALVAFAAFTAVHHLGLDLAFPALVFPGDESVVRVMLHAGILILETGALIELCRHLQGFAKAEAAVAESLAAQTENGRLMNEAAAERQRGAEEAASQAELREGKATELRIFVAEIERKLDALASGDLTIRMTDAVASDYAPVQSKFNRSVSKLESAITDVAAVVATLGTGLEEINTAADDLARRTEQQAASLEQTVAALGDVTTGVTGTAEAAGLAQTVAAKAQAEAEKGGDVVGRAVIAMNKIETSSAQIGEIIGVIDEIAFQTNLLALNAGVEAARAGDAGRGFAVVAQEVRGLAQRSADAAKQIKGLISTSSAQVEEGVHLVTQSGESLSGIVLKVGEMSRAIADIARGAKEQAVSLREVSGAADQMDKVTQQNAAMVEETTAAARNLSSETDGLATMMGTFRTRSAPAHPATPQNPAPRRAPIPQLKSTGGGGARLKAAVAPPEGWEEF